MSLEMTKFSKYFFEYCMEKIKESSVTDKQANYDKWAEDYEHDQEVSDYNSHIVFAEFLEDVLKNETTIAKSSTILDIAAGTGWVGEELRKRSFVGRMDAHDGSAQMLEVAKRKEGIYTNYFHHMIEPHTSMPEELASESYDIVAICSGLQYGFISHECINQLVQRVRVGGLFVFTTKLPNDIHAFEYNYALERTLFMLVDQGILELIDVKFSKNYRKCIFEIEKIHPPSKFLYCYKKIKTLI